MFSSPTFALSLNTETDEPPEPLTLSKLLAALKERGVEMSLSTLSEFMSSGDVAEQLGAGGDGSRREFHPAVAVVFAEFYREFQQARGKKPQAPDMLRSFLKQRMSPGTGLVSASKPVVSGISESMKPEQVAAVQGRAQGLAMTEKVLTAKEAAEILHISTRMLRKTVKPFRRFGESANGDRWLLSDLLSAE